MVRAPFNSFQRRADQTFDDRSADVDALASNEAAIAGSPLNFFDGAALFNSSRIAPGEMLRFRGADPIGGHQRFIGERSSRTGGDSG